MTQLIATALVLVLTVPAVAHASFGPAGIDLVGPEACCCDDGEGSAAGASRIQEVCCCEMRAPRRGVDGHQAAVVPGGELRVPLAAFTSVAPTSPPAYAAVDLARTKQARGPPSAGSLLAQHTSLLL